MKRYAFIDLHIHTKYSNEDGCDISVRELLDTLQAMAEKENGDVCFSITDHNSIQGCIEAYNILKAEPQKYSRLTFIPGIELNTSLKALGVTEENLSVFAKCHMLGYGFDLEDKNFNTLCNLYNFTTKIPNGNSKINTGQQLLYALREVERRYKHIFNYGLFSECIKLDNHLKVRKRLIEIIVNELHVSQDEINEFIKPFFKDSYLYSHDAITGSKQDILKLIKLIHSAGGKTSIAHAKSVRFKHPDKFNGIERREIIESFVNILQLISSHGVDAIELFHNENTMSNEFMHLYSLIQKYNLFVTCGSDFHGGILHPSAKLSKCCSGLFEYSSVQDGLRDKNNRDIIINKVQSLAFVEYMLGSKEYDTKSDFVLYNEYSGDLEFAEICDIIEKISKVDLKKFRGFYKLPSPPQTKKKKKKTKTAKIDKSNYKPLNIFELTTTSDYVQPLPKKKKGKYKHKRKLDNFKVKTKPNIKVKHKHQTEEYLENYINNC